jgi:ribosomal protein S18 acetylase RimI-like enzyme
MISIRQAKKEDFEALEKLYKELEEDAVLYQPEHFVFSKKGQRSQQLEQILQSENQIMLVAEEDGDGQGGFAKVVIGFAHVTFAHAKEISCLKSQSNIYLQDLVVTKKLRSRGIGTLLLNAAKKYGKEKGADFFRTQVFPQNKDGLRFYERNGFSLKMLTIECDL